MTKKEAGDKGRDAANATKALVLAARKAKFLEVFDGVACNVSQACKAAGVSRQTYFNWKKDDEKFATVVKDSQEALIDFAESMLMKKIKAEDNTAIIFFLKCRAKERGYIERVEHSGIAGAPIAHHHGIDMEWLNEELPKDALSSIVKKLGNRL